MGARMRLIEADKDVAEGMAWLAARDPVLADAYAQTGPLPLRRKPDGFAELLSSIVSQQVSTASAAAIWSRMQCAGMVTPSACAAASPEELQSLGLSRPKIRYTHALARAGIDYTALRGLPTADVIATLTAVPGIGPWTAELYCLQALGHRDVFPAADLALQEATKRLYDLPERPNEKHMRARAAHWSPWAAVAARLLWAYYRISTDREGIR